MVNMKCISKTKLGRRASDLIRSNEGTSLVLVTIIAIIIITGVIILRTTTSALWASADKQLNQDRAYEIATSLGESLDSYIAGNNSVDFAGLAHTETINELPDARVVVTTEIPATPNGYYHLHVRAEVADAQYTYTATYTNSGVGQAASFRRVY